MSNTPTEIETVLEEKIIKGEAPLGLYDTGLCYIIAYMEEDDIKFTWFTNINDLNDYWSE